MLIIQEAMKTETFWGSIIGISSLFLIIMLIIIDHCRHPEIYSGKPKKETKTPKKKGTDRAT